VRRAQMPCVDAQRSVRAANLPPFAIVAPARPCDEGA